MPDGLKQLVTNQFGPQAEAYLVSAAHASGPDLERLSKLVADRQPERVLDLGCGAGHVGFTVAPFAASVIAYDLVPEMLAVVAAEAARRGLAHLSTRQGSAEHLPFEDAAFDLVVTRFSAHHWADLDRALAEVGRVLQPDGQAILIDTAAPDNPLLDTHLQTVELLRDPSHVRDYREAEWCAALARAGLTVDRTAQHRLRLDFGAWIERIRTPPLHRDAIRSLQRGSPREVIDHFQIEQDGSFMLDVVMIDAAKPHP